MGILRLFHVKHANTATRPAPGGTSTSTRRTRNMSSSDADHRSPVGGSLITIRPRSSATTSRRAWRSVSAGGAKLRATTASAGSLHSYIATSVQIASTRGSSSRRAIMRCNPSMRRVERSSNLTWRSGRATAMTSPGTPPPLPRSNTVPRTGLSAVRKPSAWRTSRLTSPGPNAPRRWAMPSASIRARRSSSFRIRRRRRLPRRH